MTVFLGVGKYTPTDAVCPMCKGILIEDEVHVLMKCPLYDDLRYPLFLEASFFI